MIALTDETLERAGYRKFDWNGGVSWEWWKPIYQPVDSTQWAFSRRICVRFNEFPDSVRTYVLSNQGQLAARGVETLEDLEELRKLLDGPNRDRLAAPWFQVAGKLGRWAKGGRKGDRYLKLRDLGKASYRKILTAEKTETWHYVKVTLEEEALTRVVWCGVQVYGIV